MNSRNGVEEKKYLDLFIHSENFFQLACFQNANEVRICCCITDVGYFGGSIWLCSNNDLEAMYCKYPRGMQWQCRSRSSWKWQT